MPTPTFSARSLSEWIDLDLSGVHLKEHVVEFTDHDNRLTLFVILEAQIGGHRGNIGVLKSGGNIDGQLVISTRYWLLIEKHIPLNSYISV